MKMQAHGGRNRRSGGRIGGAEVQAGGRRLESEEQRSNRGCEGPGGRAAAGIGGAEVGGLNRGSRGRRPRTCGAAAGFSNRPERKERQAARRRNPGAAILFFPLSLSSLSSSSLCFGALQRRGLPRGGIRDGISRAHLALCPVLLRALLFYGRAASASPSPTPWRRFMPLGDAIAREGVASETA